MSQHDSEPTPRRRANGLQGNLPFWLRTRMEGISASSGKRGRSIRLAILTSMLSKGGTALLQLVSIPIAIRVLTFEVYSIYATVAVAIAIVGLFQVGIGPALAHGISRAVARGSTDAEKNYYATSFYLMATMAITGGLAAAFILANVPIPVLFGSAYAAHAATMHSALSLGVVIILIQFVLTHTERTREGYLEVNINNLWGAAGNVLGALSVGIGIFFFPTIEFLLLAVFGSNVVGKIGNTIHLLIKRPHLLPSPRRFQSRLARELFKDGFAFSMAGSLTPLIEFNACALIIGHLAGPSSVGIFNILIQIDTILVGVILMFTTPTWPAVVDACARRDFAWIHSTARRLRTFAFGYAGLAGVGLILLGPIVIPLWLGDDVHISRTTFLAFALFFFVGVRNHVNHSLLVGIGKVVESSRYIVLESAIILGPAVIGISLFGLPGLLAGMVLTKALVTGIIFPRIFSNAMEVEEKSKPTFPHHQEPATAP